MKRFLDLVGIDRAIAYTLVGRGWAIVAGLMTVLMVSRSLTAVDQGFYYTFSSVLALQVFFDLGLCYVVMQSASHEKARLNWTDGGILEGAPISKARLNSLLRFAVSWYGAAAILIMAVVLPAGLAFFSYHQPLSVQPHHWKLAWSWLVCAAALNLSASPVYALLQGCGLVSEVALLQVGQSIVGNLLVWLALSRGWGLLAIPLYNTGSFLYGVGWLVVEKRAFLRQCYLADSKETGISWAAEIWPFQWKIAVSWLSGYFMSQLFTPIIFVYHGAIPAGQLGMSITIVTGLGTVALAWVTTKAPSFGVLVANRNYAQLDKNFFLCLTQSLGLIVSAGACVWLSVVFLHHTRHPFAARILPPVPFGLLILTAVVNHIVFSEAIYLRAHKEEPFLLPSVLSGCVVGVSAYLLGRFCGMTEMLGGYLMASLISGLGLGTWIFVKKRRAWHLVVSSDSLNLMETDGRIA